MSNNSSTASGTFSNQRWIEAICWVDSHVNVGRIPTIEEITAEFGDDPDFYALECAISRARGARQIQKHIERQAKIRGTNGT